MKQAQEYKKYIIASKDSKLSPCLEGIMCYSNKMMFFLLVAAFLMHPFNAFCMDIKREVIPIIQMLQEGKAKISPDKKSIIDENGNTVGKETANVNINKNKPVANPPDAAKDSSGPAPQLFFCSKKCAVITKHCYMDSNDNIVCINICDKESLICE